MAILKVSKSGLQTLIFFLYRTLLVAGSPFILAYLIYRGIKDRDYLRSLPQRLGFEPIRVTAPGSIWLHAVSVGEVLSGVGLIGRLRESFPNARVYISVSTITGKKLASERLEKSVDGIFYAPLDFVFVVRRILRAIKPALVIVMETEIWPNLFREAKRFGASLMVVNGRISDRALPRYERLSWFFQPVLKLPGRILTQGPQDTARYIYLGAPAESVFEAGNLKYDFNASSAVPPQLVAEFVARCAPSLVLIAASTMPGLDGGDIDEDDAVIEAYKSWSAEFSRLLMILVPRRPDRFDLAAGKLAAAKIPFLRRSALRPGYELALPGVLLLDSMGELGGLFPLADVVFMGGTIARRGGHNILEPASFGKAVVAGPHMENFAEIARDFTDGGGLVRFEKPEELVASIARLLAAGGERKLIGDRAKLLAESKRGATDRILAALREQYDLAAPCKVQFLWRRLLFTPFAMVWGFVSAWNIRYKQSNAKSVSTPVISVGGLGMGGAGKTPFVLWLARKLQLEGETPAFLTRGYRRRSTGNVRVFPPGQQCHTGVTGEEAQILLRSGVGPVGISATRLDAALELEKMFHPSVFLLDDGFQHGQLSRNIDIVLIDTLDPFCGGAPFPLGRQREFPDALGRASILVLTRCGSGRSYRGLISELRKWNSSAPVFLSRVKALALVEASGGQRFPLEILKDKRVAAFCGLGNPASFWKSLEELGYEPIYRWKFGDHHHYKPEELTRVEQQALAEGADVLVTTQKDFLNLPTRWREAAPNLPLYWLDVDLEVEGEAELLEFVTLHLKQKPLHL